MVALGIMTFAAAFHAYWAVGGQRGWTVSLPQRPDGASVLHSRIGWWRTGAALVALALAGIITLALSELGVLAYMPPSAWHRWLFIGLAVLILLRCIVPNPWTGFFKTVRDTRWARFDTRYYSSLFVALGIALSVIALT